MAWSHHTKYRHYIRLYPQGSTTHDEIDIEEYFKCRYVSLENADNPSIKSVYSEDYAEHDGQRVYSSPDIAYNASELTLTLRWRSEECGDVQEWSEKFIEYITGKNLEYHDTFRPNKFWQLIFKDSPSIKAERLYGNQQYRFISFKMSNFGGRPYKQSQL